MFVPTPMEYAEQKILDLPIPVANLIGLIKEQMSTKSPIYFADGFYVEIEIAYEGTEECLQQALAVFRNHRWYVFNQGKHPTSQNQMLRLSFP